MTAQPTLWDPPSPPDTATAARMEGIDRSGRNADPAWKAAAADAVAWCASNLADFTADDVLERLAELGAPPTHNLAALGPVVLAAARAGTITKTGEWRLSRIARRHRDLVVWGGAVAAVAVNRPAAGAAPQPGGPAGRWSRRAPSGDSSATPPPP